MWKKLLPLSLLLVLIGIPVMASSVMAAVAYFTKPGAYNNSPLHCAAVFKGGTPDNARFVCTVIPTEIRYVCRNRGTNSDNANSQIFLPNAEPLTKAQFGTKFSIQKNGKSSGDIEFTDGDIEAALAAADPPVVLNAATLCPNRNYTIQYVITSGILFADLLTTPTTSQSCVPTNPTTCDTSSNGVPSGCTQVECYSMDPCSKPDPTSFAKENYNCTCQQHYVDGVVLGPPC
jgi:hypothetical protein